MKFLLSFFLFGLVPFSQALRPSISAVVTYPPDTPDLVLDRAKEVILDAGGVITHEYHLIKGFAAEASVDVLRSISTLSLAYGPLIEEDKVVSIDGSFVGEEKF